MTYTGNFGVKVRKEDNFTFPAPEANSRVSSLCALFLPVSGLLHAAVF